MNDLEAVRALPAHFRRAVRRQFRPARPAAVPAGAPGSHRRPVRRCAATNCSPVTAATASMPAKNSCDACCRSRYAGRCSASWPGSIPQMDWAPRFLRARHTFHELSLDTAHGFFCQSVGGRRRDAGGAVLPASQARARRAISAADTIAHYFRRGAHRRCCWPRRNMST